MDGRADFYGPLLYSPWLLWLGPGLVVLLAGWFLYVFISTRRPRTPAERPLPASDLNALRADFLERIDRVAADTQSGRLPARQAHQELSLLVRLFVQSASGVAAPRMTLAEFKENGPPAVANAIGRIYPGEFAAYPQESPAAAAETAREVVRSWS
jgi:hypothetical protein